MSYTEVGRLNKPFGVKGQIKVKANDAFLDDLYSCDTWFVKVKEDIIPYFVESVEDDVHFLVKFEDVDNPEDCKSISGASLYLRDKDITIDSTSTSPEYDKLLGFIIQDVESKKLVGKIDRIEEYPHQLMAIVIHKSDTILIPLNADWIKDINVEKRTILMDLPDGIISSQL